MHTYRKLYRADIKNGSKLHLLNDMTGGGGKRAKAADEEAEDLVNII